ncbi:MAG: nitrate reductase molybdenum cofactor assembly chaperone [Sterolibacterium sp.]|nr:nitrate reductase molybdenum cofactor assembly chaperone [Sterolibacterium sp.]
MNPGHTYRALSALLSYPGAALPEHLDELEQVFAADKRLHIEDRGALTALLDELRQRDLMDSESAYIDTFDRGSAASLNLFEHVHGDSRDRGQAMVDLLELYRTKDLELSVRDLPDHLPVFLEFLSLLDETEAKQQLQEIQHLVETIGATLTRRASPYAAVFQALLRLAGEKHPGQLLANREGAPVPEDTSLEAIDQAWLDQPVDFLGACSPNHAPKKKSEQVIKFQGRVA